MDEQRAQQAGRTQGRGGGAGRLAARLLAHLVRALAGYGVVMRRNIELFVGSGLLVAGLLNWSSGKYCDGNTADYLSCTRPTTYYYYGGFEIALVIIGAFLLLIWFLRERDAR